MSPENTNGEVAARVNPCTSPAPPTEMRPTRFMPTFMTNCPAVLNSTVMTMSRKSLIMSPRASLLGDGRTGAAPSGGLAVLGGGPREALLDQEPQVREAVAPLVQLHLADALAVVDVALAEPHRRGEERLQLDLLAEGHAVGGEVEQRQHAPPEHPHARLRVLHRHAVEDRGGEREHAVPELVGGVHAGRGAEGEARGGQEVEPAAHQLVDQARDGL